MDPVETPPGASLVDSNGDGALTITDTLAWLGDLFFLPGDWAIWVAATYLGPVARFLELGPGAYGGVLSGFLSAVTWITLVVVVAIAFQAIRDLDQALTAAIVRGWQELERLYRVAVRRIKLRDYGVRRREPVLDYAEELTVSADELRVLRLHATIDDGERLEAAEIARRLKLLRDDVTRICSGLVQQKLLVASRNSEGETCYALTQAGSALLVFGQLAAKKGAAQQAPRNSPPPARRPQRSPAAAP